MGQSTSNSKNQNKHQTAIQQIKRHSMIDGPCQDYNEEEWEKKPQENLTENIIKEITPTSEKRNRLASVDTETVKTQLNFEDDTENLEKFEDENFHVKQRPLVVLHRNQKGVERVKSIAGYGDEFKTFRDLEMAQQICNTPTIKIHAPSPRSAKKHALGPMATKALDNEMEEKLEKRRSGTQILKEIVYKSEIEQVEETKKRLSFMTQDEVEEE